MTKQIFKWLVILLGLGIPYLLIYKAFFLSGPLAWGDAPFFASENLKELFNLPLLWNYRHDNFGSPQYHILWLYFPTYLYGLLNQYLGLGNDFLIRLIFYFPATILAIVGSWKFIGKFNQNLGGKFLGSFLYGFNTYFLMLIDGGQVGVSLAYGLFPLTAVYVLNYLKNLTVKNYLWAMITLFILFSVDIRIGIVLVFFVGVIRVISGLGGSLRGLGILGLSIIGLSAYWIVPTISNLELGKLGSLEALSSGTNFINLTNSLFLFQPHFPLNQFGKTIPTPFYFIFLLPLIFGSLILENKVKDLFQRKAILKFSLVFLFFVFLAKGGSEPFGNFYAWLVSLPGGVAFRDSSKFYLPLILTGGVLLSFTVSSLGDLFKRKILFGVFIALFYGYLLLLIYPALLGNLSGVLGGLEELKGVDYGKISSQMRKEPYFARSLWFEEKPALFYGSWEKPALSANTLYKDRPFASMITGKYDLFNYLYSSQFCQWLDLLGINYIFIPPSERKKIVDEEEKQYWDRTLTEVNNISCLSPVADISFPAFKNKESKPLIFAQNKASLIIGGEEIYDHILKLPNFSLANQGFLFIEQGKLDVQSLNKIDPQSLTLIFARKDLIDLGMSYFSKEMISSEQSQENQWKVYTSSDYLVWKYELLKQDIDSLEFDYSKGVSLSTVPGEKIKFTLPVPVSGSYSLPIRFTNSLGNSLKIRVLGQEFLLTNDHPERFKWEVLGPFNVEQKDVEIEVINNGSFGLFNTLAFIPEETLKLAQQDAFNLTQKFDAVFVKEESDWNKVGNLLGKENINLTYNQIDPTQYRISNLPTQPFWLVFSDHYDKGWNLKGVNNVPHVPLYGMVNGFYIDGSLDSLDLFYSPQEKVEIGVFVSLLSGGIILTCLSALIWKKRKSKSEL